jgi:AraC-like DNA-binding protein
VIQETLALSFLYLLGGIQALFIAIYLLIKKNKNRQVSIFLSLILIGLFFTLYDYFVVHNNLYRDVSHFLMLSYIFQLAFAPLTYLLIKGIVFPTRNFKRIELLHFIPAVIFLLYGIFTFHIHPLEYKITYVEHFLQQTNTNAAGVNPLYQLFHLLNAAQLIVYLAASLRCVKKYGISSDLKKPISIKKLKWFFWTIAGIDIILLISTLRLRYLIYSISQFDIGLFLLIVLSLYLFYVAYFIILNHEIFERVTVKYESSSLSQSEKDNICGKLQKYITEEKPYYNTKMSIKMLSEQTDIPVRQLSQVINEEYGFNFYDFINYYRIKEAQELLVSEQGKQFSILGIAYEVGFNSKSSFYSAFKKFTGVTPNQFQKQQISK